MTKVLLDTDIGTDVDDAVCLAYLLSQPDCDLLGITTVTGQAMQRAALASVICKAAGRDIPIYPGGETPMVGRQRQPVAQQAAALPRWSHQERFPEGQAIDFMRSTIRANPGEVVLLTVGPLTNAGLLFDQYPEIPTLLKGFVMMGGIFHGEDPTQGAVEWNVAGDPRATSIVYAARPPLHRSLGLDVTQKVVMPEKEVRRRFTAPLLAPVLDFAEIWFRGFYPAITFHDPLAAATIFDESLCAYEMGSVTVDPDDQPGRTRFSPGGPGSPHQIAVSVNPARYFDHFLSVVSR